MRSQFRLTAHAALATILCATALTSVFADSGWVVPVLGAVVIVSGSCALVRASRLPSMFEPIVAAVMVLLWVTFIDERHRAHLGFIPGRLAFRRLGGLARSGFDEIHRLPTPVPARHGLVLLTVVGVAAIALVVDLLTVTMRNAALAGLPLLALFAVCAATGHHGINIFSFVAASVGYLWLLYVDNREKVARWGAAVGAGTRARPASTWSTDPTGGPAPGSLARRVGATAIGIGVVVPLLVPGLRTGIDKHNTGDGGSGTGGNTKIVINPIVSVAADLTSRTNEPVISYHSSSPEPGYLRLTSLDEFNGNTFSAGKLTAPTHGSANGGLPVKGPVGQEVTTWFVISPSLSLNYLPVTETALRVTVGRGWVYDRATATIFSATNTTNSLRYTEFSVPDQPTASQFVTSPPARASNLSSALDADLTAPVPAAVRNLTQSVIAGASTPYARAIAIQRFFTTGSRFTYDTTVKPVDSPDALSNFLLRTRRGFCQQYAFAMAVMARLAGIPSRVAVGFTRGTQESDGSWLVSTHDAHAWPELYFVDLGWVPFEPTPRGDGQAIVPSYARGNGLTAPDRGHQGGPKPPSGPGHVPPNLRNNPTAGFAGGSTTGGSGSSSAGSGPSSPAGIVALLTIAVLIVIPGVVRMITRGRRRRRLRDPDVATGAAWAELRDTTVDLSLPWDDGHTPRQNAAGLIDALQPDPQTRSALLRLALAEERCRYAPHHEHAPAQLRSDLSAVTTAATAACSWPARARARLLPRSTLQAAVSMAAALRGSVDGAVAALRGRVGPSGRAAGTARS